MPAPKRLPTAADLTALQNSGVLEQFVERAGPSKWSREAFLSLHEHAEDLVGLINQDDLERHLETLHANRFRQPPRTHSGVPFMLEDLVAPQTQSSACLVHPEDFARRYAYQPTRADFFLGRCPMTRTPLGYNDPAHVIMFCKTRAGKGAGIIIPNHLQWPGSLVSVDPKGENATVSAARRGDGSEYARGMGQKVVVLDPFHTAKSVDPKYRGSFNPLEELNADDPATFTKAQAIAEAMVVRSGHETEEYWKDEPVAILHTVILHVVTSPQFKDRRNLLTVRELVSGGDEQAAANRDRRNPDQKTPSDPVAMLFAMMMINKHPLFGDAIRRKARKLLKLVKTSERQWVGVDSGLDVQTRWLDDPRMQDVVSSSSFKLSEFKGLSEGLSVYLCLPERDNKGYNRWQRIIINQIAYELRGDLERGATGHHTLFSLDEFANLDHLQEFEVGVSHFAGYGIRLMMVFQDLSQLKKKYPNGWQSFLGNSSAKIFFDLEDIETQEYAQKLAGQIELVRQSASEGRSGGMSQGVGIGQVRGQTASIGKTQSTTDATMHGRTRSSGSSLAHGTSNTQGASRALGSTTSDTDGYSKTAGQSFTNSSGSSIAHSSNESGTQGASYDDPGLLLRTLGEGDGLLASIMQDNRKNSDSHTRGSGLTKSTNQSSGSTHSGSLTNSHSTTNARSLTDTSSSSHTDSSTRTDSSQSGTTDSQTRSDTQGLTHQLASQQSSSLNTNINMSQQQSLGLQEVYQLRHLFHLYELRQFFARQNDKSHPFYPGLALVFVSSEPPALVRRINYYED